MLNDIKFLGIGSSYYTNNYETSFYYKEKNKMLLMDCCPSTFYRIKTLHILDGVKYLYVCLTSPSLTNIGSLAELIKYTKKMYHFKLTLLLPSNYIFIENIKEILLFSGLKFISDYDITFNLLNVFEKIVNVMYFNVKSTNFVESYAYKFYLTDGTFFIYAGNTSNFSEIINNCKDSNDYKFDKAILNCSFYEYGKEKQFKNFTQRICHYIPVNLRNKCYIVGFDCDFDKSQTKNLGFNIINSVYK